MFPTKGEAAAELAKRGYPTSWDMVAGGLAPIISSLIKITVV